MIHWKKKNWLKLCINSLFNLYLISWSKIILNIFGAELFLSISCFIYSMFAHYMSAQTWKKSMVAATYIIRTQVSSSVRELTRYRHVFNFCHVYTSCQFQCTEALKLTITHLIIWLQFLISLFYQLLLLVYKK